MTKFPNLTKWDLKSQQPSANPDDYKKALHLITRKAFGLSAINQKDEVFIDQAYKCVL